MQLRRPSTQKNGQRTAKEKARISQMTSRSCSPPAKLPLQAQIRSLYWPAPNHAGRLNEAVRESRAVYSNTRWDQRGNAARQSRRRNARAPRAQGVVLRKGRSFELFTRNAANARAPAASEASLASNWTPPKAPPAAHVSRAVRCGAGAKLPFGRLLPVDCCASRGSRSWDNKYQSYALCSWESDGRAAKPGR